MDPNEIRGLQGLMICQCRLSVVTSGPRSYRVSIVGEIMCAGREEVHGESVLRSNFVSLTALKLSLVIKNNINKY